MRILPNKLYNEVNVETNVMIWLQGNSVQVRFKQSCHAALHPECFKCKGFVFLYPRGENSLDCVLPWPGHTLLPDSPPPHPRSYTTVQHCVSDKN